MNSSPSAENEITQETPILLHPQLGDILFIVSPQNNDYHHKMFLITYIDSTQIQILDTVDKKKYSLFLNT
jgi:hypothetical protein